MLNHSAGIQELVQQPEQHFNANPEAQAQFVLLLRERRCSVNEQAWIG